MEEETSNIVFMFESVADSSSFVCDTLLEIPKIKQWDIKKFDRKQMGEYSGALLSLQFLKPKIILCFSCKQHSDTNDSETGPLFIFELVQSIKPAVVIMLDDDKGDVPIYNNLSMFVPFFVRHYQLRKEERIFLSNNLQRLIFSIPLGPKTSLQTGKQQEFANKEKKLSWAYINATNIQFEADARFMLDTLLESKEESMKYHLVDDANNIDVLRDSVFVRNVVCNFIDIGANESHFLYEVIEAGAMPVVVGTNDQITNSFGHLRNPPFVFATSWLQARDKMEMLLKPENQELLSKGQESLQTWWKECIASYQRTLRVMLGLKKQTTPTQNQKE